MIIIKLTFLILLVVFALTLTRKKELKEKKETTEILEFGFLTKGLLDELEDHGILCKDKIPQTIRLSNLRVCIIKKDGKTISLSIYSWPSGLWDTRKINNESNLMKYSHIFYLYTSPEIEDNTGYLSKLVENIIFETHRMSEGITMDISDNPEFFEKEFGFEKYKSDKMILKFNDGFSVI